MFDTKGTEVSFQSSDGNWGDSEVLFKGRNFEMIVSLFELYKIRCKVTNATLQRVTDKPSIFTPSRWFDDYEQKKWQVPLAKRHSSLDNESNYPTASMEHCYNNGATKEELALATKRADEYISSL